MYFSFKGYFKDEKKKWLRKTFVGGHNKIYSYNYETISNIWGGGCKHKWVIGVYIDGEKNIEKYKAKWERKYRFKVMLDMDHITLVHCTKPIKVYGWCERNMSGKYTFIPITREENNKDVLEGYLFTASTEADALAFKLWWA